MPDNKIPNPSTSLLDQDMRIHEVIALFGSNPNLAPILAELAEKSEGLSVVGSRVGTLTAKILEDGQLEIRFISRWPIRRSQLYPHPVW